jgi:hypothetical protein
MQQGKPGSFEHLVYERISLLTIWALMAFVVQFDAHKRTQRRWVAQQEVNMLAVNLVGVHAELAAVVGFNPEQIAEIHFGEQQCLLTDNGLQHLEVAQFGGREEIIAQEIGELFWGRRGIPFALAREQRNDEIHDIICRRLREANGL